MNEYKKRQRCAICGNTELKEIINFGKVPLAGNFPLTNTIADPVYDLSLLFCNQCSLLQTNSIIDSDFLFRDYRYLSSIGLSNHFTSVAQLYKNRFSLNEESNVLEIGSNDGVLLLPFNQLKIPAVGFEPSLNVSAIAKEKGCNVISDYFNVENAKKYISPFSFDLVIANNCFAHIDDIHAIVTGAKYALKESGHFVIEVHYLQNLINENQYDFVYHEHLYYYSVIALNNLFSQHQMTIVDFDEISIHSGSIRVYVANKISPLPSKVQQRLSSEKDLGMDKEQYYHAFAGKVFAHIEQLKMELQKLKSTGKKIVGYGASGRANMLFNMCKLTIETIDYVVDDSPERCNRYIAGVHVPIVSKEVLENDTPDYVVLFAWNYAEMIMDKLGKNKYKYIIPFPTFKLIN